MRITFFLLLVTFFSVISISQNQNISNGLAFDGEPYLVIDPSNSQHLVAAWMGFQFGQKITIKTSFSNDGGTTWSTPIWQAHQVAGNSSADVSMGYDLNGNLYLAYIDYDNVNFTNGAIYLHKSTNGGLSWGTAIEAISILDCPNKLCVDRPWMVIDKSSGINDGAIYITSMNPDQPTLVTPPYNPFLAVSTDNGNSFSAPRYIDTLGYYAGSTITQALPSPAVSATGVFYAMYPSYEPVNQGPFAHLYLAKSTNTGVTLTHNNAYTGTGGTVTDPYVKKGTLLKSNPANSNHLAFFYLSQLNGDADIYFIESLDGGLNWSTQQRINQDPVGNGKLQDLVWADFDLDGDLAVCWRDRRNASGNTYQEPSEIYGCVRWKDSANFSQDFPISDAAAAHDVVLEGSGNDFMNVNFLNDTIYAVWGDVRTGVLSIYLNKFGVASNTNSISIISQQDIPSITVYPNPTTDKIFIKETISFTSYQIIDLQGNVVLEGKKFPKSGLDVTQLTSGSYLLHFNQKGKVLLSTFLKN